MVSKAKFGQVNKNRWQRSKWWEYISSNRKFIEDISLICNQGLEVDDKNEPAPKNASEGNESPLMLNLDTGMTWGWDDIGHYSVVINTKNNMIFENWKLLDPSWKIMDGLFSISSLLCGCLMLFHCCMDAFFREIFENQGNALGNCKFIHYIWLLLLIATCQGWSKTEFWYSNDFNPRIYSCPFKFYKLMRNGCFDKMTLDLGFTKMDPRIHHDLAETWSINEWSCFSQPGLFIWKNQYQSDSINRFVLGRSFVLKLVLRPW